MQVSNNRTRQLRKARFGAYATEEDFGRIFSEEISSLYLLSLLLTADQKKAEQCCVRAMEGCSAGWPIFKQWAHSWSRRIIIQGAIRFISPSKNQVSESAAMDVSGLAEHSELDMLLAVTQLPSFERFVFVMSILERHSDRDCCILLGCSRPEFINARAHALEVLATLQSPSLKRTERIQFTKAIAVGYTQ